MTEAFPKNDLALADFDGHRKAHLLMISDAVVMQGYKQDATKKIVGWVLAGAGFLLLSGAVNYFLGIAR